MTNPSHPEAAEIKVHPAVESLINSASRWMDDALKAWAEGDYAKVAVLAPLAVEHLGKATLWRTNPVLIVPLSQDAEHSLISLATKPDISDPRLRTISLAVLLRRLEQILGMLPIDKKRCSRMVEIRNGAMHVGSPNESRHVLLDALALCKPLLERLKEDPLIFYGEHYWTARSLLEEKLSEAGHRVAAKRASARNHLTALEERLGDILFMETTHKLEKQAAELLDPEDFGSGFYGVHQECPECRSNGRLLGRVDGDPQPDWDVEPLGNGHYEPVLAGFQWELTFQPQIYICFVCRLELYGTDELSEGGLPAASSDISQEDLGEVAFDRLIESFQYDGF